MNPSSSAKPKRNPKSSSRKRTSRKIGEHGAGADSPKLESISKSLVTSPMDVLPYLPRESIREDSLVDTQSAYLDEQTILKLQSDDLSKLLKMRFAVFVSYVAYEASIVKFLDTFLWYGPSNLDTCQNQDLFALETEVATKVLMVLYRITCSEEALAYKEVLGQVLFDNWIFDTPKMIGIASIYFHSNPEVTKSIISSVFELQPQYHEDMIANMAVVVKAIKSFNAKYDKTRNGINQTPRKLIEARKSMMDTLLSCRWFLLSCPEAAMPLLEQNIAQQAVTLVDVSLPMLEADLETLSKQSRFANEFTHVDSDGKYARILAVELLHTTICSFTPPNGNFAEAKGKNLKDLIHSLWVSMLETKAKESNRKTLRRTLRPNDFLRMFAYVHPIKPLLADLQKAGCLLEEQVAFLTKAVEAEIGTSPQQQEAPPRTKAMEMDCVNGLRQIFAFSKDFAEECARTYQYDQQRAVSAVLEHKLPSQLSSVRDPSKWIRGLSSSSNRSKAQRMAPPLVRFKSEESVDGIENDQDRKFIKNLLQHYCDEYEDEPDDGLDPFDNFDVQDGDNYGAASKNEDDRNAVKGNETDAKSGEGRSSKKASSRRGDGSGRGGTGSYDDSSRKQKSDKNKEPKEVKDHRPHANRNRSSANKRDGTQDSHSFRGRNRSSRRNTNNNANRNNNDVNNDSNADGKDSKVRGRGGRGSEGRGSRGGRGRGGRLGRRAYKNRNKAKIGNHNRKAGASRKMAKAGL